MCENALRRLQDLEKRRENKCNRVSNNQLFNNTSAHTGFEMKPSAGSKSQKTTLVFVKAFQSDPWTPREPYKMAEVCGAETGHVLEGGLSERGQCEEALNPE